MYNQGGQKRCTTCGEIKDLSEFTQKDRLKGVLHNYCRECHAKWNREHYQRNKATYIANAHRNAARFWEANLDRIVQYLLDHPCVDCGETDVIVLEFDHRDASAKLLAVSSMLRNYGWAQIEAEIAKCDVRCANDYRRRTAEQLDFRKLALARMAAQDRAGAAGLEPATSDFGDRRSTN